MATPFVFFGTSRFSVIFCEELKNKYGILPSLIIVAPDRPVGRKQIITPPPMKEWAKLNNIDILQPEKLKDDELLEKIKKYELFVVASYGTIIPQVILDIPRLGILNIHPSLLPKYRGASPIQNQILNNKKIIGTTIILMDAEMDHGKIVIQKEIEVAVVDTYQNTEEKLAIESAALFVSVIQDFIDGKIEPVPQKHEDATYTKLVLKADGEINLSDDGLKNYLKYLAYNEWPKTFFFTETEGGTKRNIITEALFKDGAFIIKKIVPEGKKETAYHPKLPLA